ncbi:alpha-carbonic anhydrase [Daphnia sinensis]|uniref:Carbonic anhydrase n=1 Tax=Daphnia sinensis TaxID=1820382 RepID=A0AAD5PX67_9CRUS|nr:alpha-carbonic anhydrase [Daphnia sinensis]
MRTVRVGGINDGQIIYILGVIVVFFRLLPTGNGFPVIGDRETEISESGKVENTIRPEKVYTSSMFEHWSKSGWKSPSWSYKDPAAWASLPGSFCGGDQQSPIDIVPKSSVTKAYPKFTFHNYGNFDKMKIMNNGHTVVYNLAANTPADRIPYITGGGLNDKYQFHSFHLHWGSDSSKGSEHLIKSKSYPAELHMVHYNTKYGTFEDATTHSDGLAVLGIFIKVGLADNEFFQPLVDEISNVLLNQDETTLNRIVSFQNLLPQKTTSFFRYSGSLTTPNCNEIVIWTVFENPIKVSERQLNMFRNLNDAANQQLVNNYRPAQQVKGRIIYYRRYNGCELKESWPFTSTPLLDAFRYSQCLINYALSWE